MKKLSKRAKTTSAKKRKTIAAKKEASAVNETIQGEISNTAPNMIQSGSKEFSLVWGSAGSPPTIFIEKSTTPDFGGRGGANTTLYQDYPPITPNTPALVNYYGKTFIAWTNWFLNHHIYLSALSSFK